MVQLIVAYPFVSNFRRDNRADASSNNAIVKAIWNHFDTLETSYQRTNYHVGLRFVINHNSKLFESGEQRYN